jgi:hypothetical protein
MPVEFFPFFNPAKTHQRSLQSDLEINDHQQETKPKKPNLTKNLHKNVLQNPPPPIIQPIPIKQLKHSITKIKIPTQNKFKTVRIAPTSA